MEIQVNQDNKGNPSDLSNRPGSQRPKILIAENEIIVALDIQQRLDRFGYVVKGLVTNGEDLLRYLGSEYPDIILMDIRLQDHMDGIDVAREIRARHIDIPIIYLAAYIDRDSLERACQVGAFGYLIKPIDDIELQATIEIALYKHRIEMDLRDSAERYMLFSQAFDVGIWDWDLINQTVYYTPRWCNMLGMQPEAVGNLPGEWLDRIHQDDEQHVRNTLNDYLLGNTPVFICEYRIRHEDGGYRWMLCRGLAVAKNGQMSRMVGSQTDITDQKRYEQELLRKALHDDLTGLHNRAAFIDRLSGALEQNKRSNIIRTVVLFLDLDRFKVINDNFGHSWGDKVLVQLAARLEGCLRPGDVTARFGGDEFMILLDQVDDTEVIKQITDRILYQIGLPFQIEEKQIYITGSIGVLLIDSTYHTTEEVLRDVDTAMYSAKTRGRNCAVVFKRKMREKHYLRLDKSNNLRRVVEKNELLLYYQPVYHTRNRVLAGFEALLRWNNTDLGLVHPRDFIPLAEETGLIMPIEKWVFNTACSHARRWNQVNRNPLKLWLNISLRQLLDELFPIMIQDALAKNTLPPELLELEITESNPIEDADRILMAFDQLRFIGVNIAINHFGRGYSSIDQLKFFPLNTIKIDGVYTREFNEKDDAIIIALNQLAHQLGLETIAEGVETENQFDRLTRLGCDMAQGIYLGRAASFETTLKLLDQWNK